MIELLTAVLIIGILSTIAVPSYQNYLRKNMETTAISDITKIAGKLKEIMTEDPTALPPDLATINVGNILPLIDPWGNPYRYFPIYGHLGDHEYMKGARKKGPDKPITSDFDLYSMGPDGETAFPLTNAKSKDDLIRADEGAFIGKASVYEPS